MIKVGLVKYVNSTMDNPKKPYTTNNDTHINMAQSHDSSEDNVKKEPFYKLPMAPTQMSKYCVKKGLIEPKKKRESVEY